jgi:ferredoxin-type protein NapG
MMADREPAVRGGCTRRQFIKGGAAVPLAMVLAVGMISVPFLRKADASGFHLRPPGALDEKRFLGACIRCGKCVHVCPYQAIRLAGPESGVVIGTPVIIPREEPCYLCPDLPCAKACPSGALNRELDNVEQVRMGTAVIVDRENCLSLRGLRCEVCYRNCPLIDKAITIEPRHNVRTGTHTIMEPVVHRDKCVGCGICEKTCVREKPVIVVQKSPPKQEDHYEF